MLYRRGLLDGADDEYKTAADPLFHSIHALRYPKSTVNSQFPFIHQIIIVQDAISSHLHSSPGGPGFCLPEAGHPVLQQAGLAFNQCFPHRDCEDYAHWRYRLGCL